MADRPNTPRDILLLVVGAVITAIVGYLWTEYIQPQDVHLTINVFDSNTPHSPLKNATVGLDANDGHHEAPTGPFGAVGFTLSHKDRHQKVTPTISLDGYRVPEGKLQLPIALDSDLVVSNIVMEKIEEPPVENAQRPPTPQIITTQEAYRSDPRPSGAGKDFSNWYTLCSPQKPAGWKLMNVTFTLVGDRSCGAWSECRPQSQNETQACWQFRMQGHDEQMGLFRQNSGIQFSAGVLTVTWQRPM
jgi:hypothetical protein